MGIGGHNTTSTSWNSPCQRARNPPLSVGELALSGKDLITELGLKPGPQIGQLLGGLLGWLSGGQQGLAVGLALAAPVWLIVDSLKAG